MYIQIFSEAKIKRTSCFGYFNLSNNVGLILKGRNNSVNILK